MSRLSEHLRSLSPYDMLRLYLVVVLLTAVIAVTSVLATASRVDGQANLSTNQAYAAVEASQISVDLRESVTVLFVTASVFLESEELDALPSDLKASLLSSALRLTEAGGSPLGRFPLPAMSVEITEQNAFELQSGVRMASERIDGLLMYGVSGVDLSPIAEERDRLTASLDAYLTSKTAESFRDTFASIIALGARLSEGADAYNAALNETQLSLAAATQVARYVAVGALVLLCLTMMGATFFVGRLIQRAFQTVESEREELLTTTTALQYRNDQLNALYNVFAEITDTLSMRYVIRATLRETLRVMHASFVTLRLLKGSQLVAAGTLSDDGDEPLLDPVPLGEGPTGRVARRGRSMRIDHGAQEQLGPSTDPEKRMESGVIVPLIVGARIVGTLSCWSYEPDAFQEQDERVLEMMASQVATAVIAADQQETLERRALSDPLTNLPNRRQLAEDMAQFATWRGEGRSVVVAMMDIDHFKQLNDDFGHKVGDVTLQKVAAVMRQAIRDTDRIYRYGGEEFVVIWPSAGHNEAVALAERVLSAVAETPLTGDHLEPVGPVTLSAGLAIMPEHGDDLTDLIVLADRAMYKAKESGRNRIEVWDGSAPRTLEPAA